MRKNPVAALAATVLAAGMVTGAAGAADAAKPVNPGGGGGGGKGTLAAPVIDYAVQGTAAGSGMCTVPVVYSLSDPERVLAVYITTSFGTGAPAVPKRNSTSAGDPAVSGETTITVTPGGTSAIYLIARATDGKWSNWVNYDPSQLPEGACA